MVHSFLNDEQRIDRFIHQVLMSEGVSSHTSTAYARDLALLMNWIQHDRKKALLECNEHDVTQFIVVRTKAGDKKSTLARRLSAYRKFFAYSLPEGAVNPLQSIRQPKLSRPLPKSIGEIDVEALLSAPDTETLTGLRDKAVLEVMYATGIRISELVSIEFHHVDLDRGLIRVLGKNQKERLVPLGENAGHWLHRYIQHSFSEKNGRYVFFGRDSQNPISRQALWYRIKLLVSEVGLSSDISPHTLRHAFATHLIDHGADIRSVQMFLGHSSLSTTQIYTKVSKYRLRLLHQEFHPGG